jgi:hypothetical protein
MSRDGEFWKTVRKQAKSVNQNPVQVGWIKSLEPLTVQYQGIELCTVNGDTIYINNLLLDENIELDLASMDEPQNIDPALWKADNTPTATVAISGTQKQFITDLYNWIKAVHNRFILHIGDYVAVQKLGKNTYLILEKLQALKDEE